MVLGAGCWAVRWWFEVVGGGRITKCFGLSLAGCLGEFRVEWAFVTQQ